MADFKLGDIVIADGRKQILTGIALTEKGSVAVKVQPEGEVITPRRGQWFHEHQVGKAPGQTAPAPKTDSK